MMMIRPVNNKDPLTANTQGLAFVEDVARPTILNPDEVLIEVVASSVDPTDIAICGGYALSLRRQLGVSHKMLILKSGVRETILTYSFFSHEFLVKNPSILSSHNDVKRAGTI